MALTPSLWSIHASHPDVARPGDSRPQMSLHLEGVAGRYREDGGLHGCGEQEC